ncbi:metal-binding protein [Pelomyxa schiedti]|nr:metal-binding protein [Pelomyxa schiedti]
MVFEGLEAGIGSLPWAALAAGGAASALVVGVMMGLGWCMRCLRGRGRGGPCDQPRGWGGCRRPRMWGAGGSRCAAPAAAPDELSRAKGIVGGILDKAGTLGAVRTKFIDPSQDIVVSRWVRLKCQFGCPTYGKNACCPPNSVDIHETREILSEYSLGVILNFSASFEKPEERRPWSQALQGELLKLERAVFLAGFHKAFLFNLDECRICGTECPAATATTGNGMHSVREMCKCQKMARPSLEGMGVDVFTTVRKAGFDIHVLQDYSETMNRFAILLIM